MKGAYKLELHRPGASPKTEEKKEKKKEELEEEVRLRVYKKELKWLKRLGQEAQKP